MSYWRSFHYSYYAVHTSGNVCLSGFIMSMLRGFIFTNVKEIKGSVGETFFINS